MGSESLLRRFICAPSKDLRLGTLGWSARCAESVTRECREREQPWRVYNTAMIWMRVRFDREKQTCSVGARIASVLERIRRVSQGHVPP